MTLFGKRVFVEVIKLRSSRWDHLGCRVSPKSNDRCPYKEKGRGKFGAYRHRAGGDGTTRAEAGVMCLQAKEGQGLQQPPEAKRKPQNRFSVRARRGKQSWWHLDLRFLASRTVREKCAVVWSHRVCGNLWWQPWETNLHSCLHKALHDPASVHVSPTLLLSCSAPVVLTLLLFFGRDRFSAVSSLWTSPLEGISPRSSLDWLLLFIQIPIKCCSLGRPSLIILLKIATSFPTHRSHFLHGFICLNVVLITTWQPTSIFLFISLFCSTLISGSLEAGNFPLVHSIFNT